MSAIGKRNNNTDRPQTENVSCVCVCVWCARVVVVALVRVSHGDMKPSSAVPRWCAGDGRASPSARRGLAAPSSRSSSDRAP
jgi:hypothetical protein